MMMQESVIRSLGLQSSTKNRTLDHIKGNIDILLFQITQFFVRVVSVIDGVEKVRIGFPGTHP